MILSNNRVILYNGKTLKDFDYDALKFIIAAGITNSVQVTALDTLYKDLKSYNLYTKMVAFYPFVGGTASSHKYNGKDPRDLDAAFRIVFAGGVTHSSNGVTFNGSTGYGNTYLNPLSHLTLHDTHFSYYSRSTNGRQNMAEIGCTSPLDQNPKMLFAIAYTGGALSLQYHNATLIAASNTNSDNLFVATRISNVNHKIYNKTTLLGTTTTTDIYSLPNVYVFIGALNKGDNTAFFYSNRECAFSSIGTGLTATDTTNLYNVVQNYQTLLSRNV